MHVRGCAPSHPVKVSVHSWAKRLFRPFLPFLFEYNTIKRILNNLNFPSKIVLVSPMRGDWFAFDYRFVLRCQFLCYYAARLSLRRGKSGGLWGSTFRPSNGRGTLIVLFMRIARLKWPIFSWRKFATLTVPWNKRLRPYPLIRTFLYNKFWLMLVFLMVNAPKLFSVLQFFPAKTLGLLGRARVHSTHCGIIWVSPLFLRLLISHFLFDKQSPIWY